MSEYSKDSQDLLNYVLTDFNSDFEQLKECSCSIRYNGMRIYDKLAAHIKKQDVRIKKLLITIGAIKQDLNEVIGLIEGLVAKLKDDQKLIGAASFNRLKDIAEPDETEQSDDLSWEDRSYTMWS